jgi:hypothetical protein
MFQSDPSSITLEQVRPPEAPMAMPAQVLEHAPRSVMSTILAAFRPVRQPSRGV